ncbi:hypothetical protein EIP86_003018 [Pleurotus ostreatoroseus]|nr:hypothetical protein EIP86_003018 [Pleurotus ostreatoroseus]
MSYSDWELDSELTELSTSSSEAEEDYKPKKAAATKAAAKEYRIGTMMKPPRTTSYSADWVFNQISEGLIDLNPSYQRDIVWPETKQVGLIDSLLRNYYIPPIIFYSWKAKSSDVATLNADKDGNKKYWYLQQAKKTLLPESYRRQFSAKQIVCVEYEELTDDQEREIFQRVQLGVPLTPAERMQAICGPWPDLVREIQATVLKEDGFVQSLEWDRSRGREFQCLSSVLYLLDNHTSSAALKFPGTPQLERMLQQTTPVSTTLKDHMFRTFRIWEVLVRDPEHSQCFQKLSRLSPCEYIMTAVLIHMKCAEFSLAQLSAAILKMREDVRRRHVDVRQNAKVSKTMYSFIKKLRAAQLPADSTEIPAIAALNLLLEDLRKAKKATKRKRAADSDDESLNKPVKSTRSGNTQKAKRSSVKVEPMKQASSGRAVTVKKPPIPSTTSAVSSRTRRSQVATKKEPLGSATVKLPASKQALSNVEVKPEPVRRRSTQTDTRLESPLLPAAGPSTLEPAKGNDRLAAIRKAKSEIAASSLQSVTLGEQQENHASGRMSIASVLNSGPSRDPRRSVSASSVPTISMRAEATIAQNNMSTVQQLGPFTHAIPNRAGPSTRAMATAAALAEAYRPAAPDAETLPVPSRFTPSTPISASERSPLDSARPLPVTTDPRRPRATTLATTDPRTSSDWRSNNPGEEGQFGGRDRHVSEGQTFGRAA